MELGCQEVAGVAAREGGHDRSRARCAEERIGWRRDAVPPVRSQCGMDAASSDDAQRPDGAQRIGLPEPWLRAKPKRLRFQIFCSAAKLVHHARQLLLRVRRTKTQLLEWIEVWRRLPIQS